MSRFELLADREGQFLTACGFGDVEEVRDMLDGGVSIEVSTPTQGWTGLLRASLNGRDEVVRELIKRGANLAARALDGRTALHAASSEGKTKVVCLLIDAAAGDLAESLIEARDAFGVTPLHAACRRNQMDTIVALVLRGANVGAVDDAGRSAEAQIGLIVHVSVRARQAAIKAIRQARATYLRDVAWRAGIRDALPAYPKPSEPAASINSDQKKTTTNPLSSMADCPHEEMQELRPSQAHRQALRNKRPKGWTVGSSRWSNEVKRVAPACCGLCGRVTASCLCLEA